MDLYLERMFSNRSQNYVHGIFYNQTGLLCYSLELPWNQNQKNISCIPSGVYKCKKVFSAKFGNVISVLDVPDRSAILIHSGNSSKDTQGCILPGLDISPGLVLNSKQALQRLLLNVPSNFTLTIRGF